MSKIVRISLFAFTALVVWAGTAQAASITCPDSGVFGRQGTFTDAIACKTVGGASGTPSATDVATQFGGTWTGEGSLAGGNGTNDWLTLTVTAGSWGSLPASGTWAINPLFWAPIASGGGGYTTAVITFHLGASAGGGALGDPDWFFFQVEPGDTSGTFSFIALEGNVGGGLSNGFLWGSTSDEPCIGCTISTPEPATLLLFGTGLVALAARLRRRRA